MTHPTLHAAARGVVESRDTPELQAWIDVLAASLKRQSQKLSASRAPGAGRKPHPRRAEVLSLLNEGASAAEVAVATGVSRGTVDRWLREKK